MYTRDLLLTE